MAGRLDPDDRAWTAQAVRLDEFLCDTVFLLPTRIQFCDAVSGRIIPGEAASLPIPNLPFIGTAGVAASFLLGHEEELVRHYQRVVAAFAGRGRLAQLQPASHPFWLRPAIIADGLVVTDCLWYDTVPQAQALLLVLASTADAPDGEIWDDLDQGWRMRIVKADGLIYVAEWDWDDTPAPPSSYGFEPIQLSRQANAALARLDVLHRHLVTAFGRDWWR